MKVLPFKIPKSERDSLIIQLDEGSSFYNKLHQHPEIQISLIVKGKGTFIIGDKIGEFYEDDLFVIGSNLPHVFNSDEIQNKQVKMISIFFTQSSFGLHFFELKEFQHLEKFFNETLLGIKLKYKRPNLNILLEKMTKHSIYHRFIIFLEVLTLISSSEYETLSSLIDFQKYEGMEGKRMRKIFQFTMQNFDQNIKLQEVADISNMSRNAFCRYFKQRTNKPYFSFLNNLRVGEASKLLLKNIDLSIADIAHQSGFNNITNFNRKFKEIKKVTPSEFRLKHKKVIP